MSTDKALIHTLPITPGNNDSDSPLNLSLSSSTARPEVAGAVGGMPPSPGSRFDAATAEADLDFMNNQTKQNQPDTNQTKPNDRYFKGDAYPRYLVIKHKDPSKNIAAESKITVGNGLREIVKKYHYQRIKIKYQFNSRLLLIEADEKLTAQRLLDAHNL